MLTEAGLATWQDDRARQALIGTRCYYEPRGMSRGDFLRLVNSGIALRTYRAAKAVR